jgi:hypothetical protein
MKTSTLETLIWVLIYGGLIVLSLSVFITHSDTMAVALAIAGIVATVAGGFLIWVRSRMKDGHS